MITFVVGADHQYTIREVFERRDHAFHRSVVIMTYRDFLMFPRLPVSDYIFLDLERLDADCHEATNRRFAALKATLPEHKMLNPPDLYPGRLEVMHRLHTAGINMFRALKLEDGFDADLDYPVFLRRLDNHEGPQSGILADATAMHREIEALVASGHPRDLLAVTEYVDARNSQGLHEKRCYFRIGPTVFPEAFDASRNWICKGEFNDPDGVVDSARELEFLQSNEDEDQLRRAFDVAGISYGRADYAIVDGRPQIFEINTNPLIDLPERAPPEELAHTALLLLRWLDALAAFSAPCGRERARWILVDGAHTLPPVPTSLRRRLLRFLLMRTGRLNLETEVVMRLRALLGTAS